MKKIVLLCLLVVLVGAGAHLYMNKKANAGNDQTSDDKELNTYSEYVELSPLILPVIDRNGLSQTVSLVVAIEVGNTSDAAKIESIAPRLQDAYIQEMYGELSYESNLSKDGVIKVKKLKKRLTEISQNIAGSIVDDVLLQVVSQHQL